MSGAAPAVGWTGVTGLRVGGGTGGVAARLEDLDVLARDLADAATDAVVLAGRVVLAVGEPALLVAVPTDPAAVARAVAAAGDGAADLCRGAGLLAGLAGSVAAAVAAYRACEDALCALAHGVPLVAGSLLRGRLAAAAVLPLPGGLPPGWLLAAAAGAAGVAVVPEDHRGGAGDADGGTVVPARVREAVVGAVVRRPALVDVTVRLLPGVLGVADVPAAARLAGGAGQATGMLVETPVTGVTTGPPTPCADPGAAVVPGSGGGPGGGAAAGGVADLLRRGQGVASWRAPRAGEHDSLPPGQVRPVPGQVRVDRVEGADGQVAWVVHVPGTQDWDGDGHGSPMDMAANVALVGGRRSGVADGVAAALVGAGALPGQPVAVVGHSQGGMTALDLAADPGLRRVASVTHVITAGSPLAGRTPPPGVQVLALEHDDDLVPRLDGRTPPGTRDRVLVRAPAPDGPWRTDAVPAHSSSAYVVTAAAVDASRHPSLLAYRRGLAPFLHREGATCTSTGVVLSRAPSVPGGSR